MLERESSYSNIHCPMKSESNIQKLSKTLNPDKGTGDKQMAQSWQSSFRTWALACYCLETVQAENCSLTTQTIRYTRELLVNWSTQKRDQAIDTF